MSGLFSSKTKSSSTSSTKVPQNYQNFLNQSLQKASEASSAPFQQYQGQRIADLSGNEQMGIQGAANNYGMYQPLVDMATMSSADLATKAGRAPTSGEMGQFINPYVDYVLGNSLDRLQEQSDTNMTKIGSSAAMSGAFGGLRHGVLEGANLAELLKSARDLSGTTYADAYDKGMGNWWKSQDSQRASIDTLLGTAKGGQAYNQGDISQLMQTGLTERTRNQGLLDFNFGEFMREQEDPLTKASFMSSIAAQYPRDIFTKTTKSESTTTDSPIKTLAGIGIAAAGIMSGNPAAAMSLGAGAGSLGSGGGGTVNPVGMPMLGGDSGGYYTVPRNAKGGLIKGYKKGGKVKKCAEGGILDDISAWGDKRDMGMVKAGLSMVAGADPLEAMDAYKEHQRYLQGSYAGGGRIGPVGNPKGLDIPAPDKSDRALEYFLRSFEPDPITAFEDNITDADLDRAEQTARRSEKEIRRMVPFAAAKKKAEHAAKRQEIQNYDFGQTSVGHSPLNALVAEMLSEPQPKMKPLRTGEDGYLAEPINEEETRAMMNHLRAVEALDPRNPFPTFTKRNKVPQMERYRAEDEVKDFFTKHPNFEPLDKPFIPYPYNPKAKREYAEGGEVKGYFLGGLANAGEMDYEAMGFSPKGIEFARGIARGRRARQEPLAAAMSMSTQQPFSWDRFNQARAMNGQLSNLTGGMQPNLAMGQRPDLSGYMTAMQNRMQPQQAFAGGGYVKKFDKGGDVFVGGRGFGPPTDPLAAISEKFAPLPSASEGINPEIIYSLATQKHETGAKEYGKPNYNARPLDENKVPLSSAAGLGQWLAESWNQIAKRDKTGTIKPRTYKQAMEGHIPSKEEQRLAWPIWMEIQKEQMGEENFNKLNNRFAHHQLGQGDYKKLLQANPDKKMREVFGDKVARNVSAFNKDKKGNIVKNETVYEYLNRLDQSMKDAEAWYLQNQENPGDVVYYGGLDPQAVAKKSLPQQAAAEVDPLAGIADVEKRSRAIDALREKEQYDAERRNWRNDLNIAQLGSNEIQMSPMEGGPRTQGRPVSPQENIANKIKSKTPIEALELFATESKYSDPIDQMLYAPKVFPGRGTTKKNYRQEQLDKFLKAKGIGTKDALSEAWNSDVDSKMQEVIGDLGIENEGPYRKGGRNFAEGGPVMRDSRGNIIPQGTQKRTPHWSDRLHEIFATPSGDTIGNVNDWIATQAGFGESNRGKVPTGYPVVMPLNPLEQAQPSVPKGALSGPNFFDSASDDVAAYYSELGNMTGADPLNAALAQGEPSAPMADAVGSGIAKDDDEALLKKMMHDRIVAMNEDKGPQQPTLFGLNVNMDLVKLGLGMLASDKNFGGALGEAGMNLIQSKEQEELRKSKENSNKLQELLDLRYKNAMMESMDPEVRAELARQKAASDMQLEKLKHQSKLDELQIQQSSMLSKNITQKEIERIQAKIANDEIPTESEKSMLWAHGIEYEQPIKAGSWLDLD